jgi:hypothetical protein
VSAGGRLFVGNGSSASSSVSAIFDDLRAKKINLAAPVHEGFACQFASHIAGVEGQAPFAGMW